MDDRYEITWFRGRRFDKWTVQRLLAMENYLGFTLDIMQGSYNTTTRQSAGTHDGGGAVDLSAYRADRVVRAGRGAGFAMWERHELWRDGERVWPHHIHGILVGNERASWAAKDQVQDYRNHLDGLAGHSWDNTWRPARIGAPPYRTAPVVRVAVDVSRLQIDFINALHGRSNQPDRQVKIIQRQMNRKMQGVKPLLVDGMVGDVTLNRWGRWEEIRKVEKPNRIPDMPRLRALLKGSIYYAKP